MCGLSDNSKKQEKGGETGKIKIKIISTQLHQDYFTQLLVLQTIEILYHFYAHKVILSLKECKRIYK